MNEENSRNSSDSNEFSWQIRKGEVMISWKGRIVTVLRRETAMKFQEKISTANEHESQMIMAKATGNFKRGNERKSS